MRRIRVIPVLLLDGNKVIKTIKFGKKTYIGDPINSVKIFNDKEVDEIIILDINASRQNHAPNFERIHDIVSEAFMPVAYGGGITEIDEIKRILSSGVEKIVLNSRALRNLRLIEECSAQFGNQSVIISIDYKKSLFGTEKVYNHVTKKLMSLGLNDFAKSVENAGAGEIFLNSVDRDGTYSGYDLKTLQKLTSSVSIPVIACGGASGVKNMYEAVKIGNASAVAAGSLFTLQRPHNAVLINFFDQDTLKKNIFEKL